MMRSAIFSTLLCVLATHKPTFAFPVCHICPLGDHSMSRGGGILNTGLKTYTCSEARKYGLDGELGDNSCKILQMYANADTSNPCGCKELQVYPVENKNPVCDICPQRTVTVTINGQTYQEMSVYPPNTNEDVHTILDRMPCGEILEMAINKWLPQGTCPQFQEDAESGGCCEVDDIEEVVVDNESSEETECAANGMPCGGDDDDTICCTGYSCKAFSCQRPVYRPVSRQSIYHRSGKHPWEYRKLLRKAKHSKSTETHN